MTPKFPNLSIAIIGMACEFPGAHSPEELWENVLAGRRFFRKAPPERLPSEYFDSDPDAPGKSYCDQMAVITDWSFDPVAFRIPPVTFQATDLAHWLALDTAGKALRSAGLKLDALRRARVGVVLGNSLTGEFSRSHNLRFRWPYVERSLRRALAGNGMTETQLQQLVASVKEVYEAPLPEITEDTLAGNMANTIAGRICNYFDFGAGGFTVDGACASSLLSVAMACNALASGEMDLALAGGVDISLDPFEIVGFAKTRALAADDIRPYDQRAAGMLTGEGCGMVVLAREAEARAAGYSIRALIRGWGYSSDGAGGLTAPEVEGQLRALRQAYARAGYPLAAVALIEGHGTGTALGDKVELTALRRLLEESPSDAVCRIGSLKANIGHCKAAAGSAGLIKTVMALERKVIPPTVNCESPNAAFGLPLGRLLPSSDGLPWASPRAPRRAAVSAMGFGGANAHITLEEAKPSENQDSEIRSQCELLPEERILLGSRQTTELIMLAADAPQDLHQQIERLWPVARRLCRAELTDLSAALSRRPVEGKLRLAIIADTPWELADTLKQCAEKLGQGAPIAALDAPANGIFAGIALADPRLVALFPMQGAQRLNMGQHWLRRFPLVQQLYDQVAQLGEENSVCRSLSQCIFRDPLSTSEETLKAWEDELRQTRLAQPAIVLSSLAAFQALVFFGLQPHLAIGHSLGELSALAAAGAWDALGAVRLAALRGEVMSVLVPAGAGAMAALGAGPGEVRKLLDLLGSPLVISNYNSPRQTVVSGPAEAIRNLGRLCDERKLACRQLAVSHAFHSELVAPAAERFRAALNRNGRNQSLALLLRHANQGLSALPAGPTVISTVTGQPVSANADLLTHLAEQIRQPVRFMDAVLKALEAKPALWLEIGPDGALTSFVRDIVSPAEVQCLPTDLPHEDGFHLLNRVLARAWVLGFPVKLDRLFAHRFHRPFDPEHYHPQLIVNPCERPADARAHAPAPANEQLLRANLEARALDDRDSLLAFALDWIARRTGFPKSAITPDKQLRDDLNLDSIKVAELVVLLAQKLNRRFDADPALVANGRIGDVIELILAKSRPREPQAHPASVPGIQAEPAASLAEWTRVFRLERAPVPLPDGLRLPLPLDGACFIVAEPNCPRAAATAARLRSLGLAPALTDADSLLRSGEAPSNLAMLVLLLPEVSQPFLACTPAEFERRVEGAASVLFRVFRWAGHSRDGAGLRGLILRPANSASDCGSDLDGGGGFLKSLGLEYPAANFKWLALPTEWPPEQWAEVAVQELQAPKDRVAFAYTPDGRRLADMAALPSLVVDPAPPASPPPITDSLGPHDVVLVSGGAKGITCELALALAQSTHCQLALLGSSPLPEAPPNPPENELLHNLQRFQACGVRHRYFQADVTDLRAVQQAVREAERTLGPITAILHGAGVTRLRLFRDKELDEFLKCIRVKARGLYNLLTAVPPAQLKALHVISSVLGRTGMAGQTDYCLANAWLDGALRSVKLAYPRLRCLSLAYSAWAETGLARRVGALDSLRSLGVTPISVPEGIAAYLDLVPPDQPDGAFVITGRLTADFEAGLYPPTTRPCGRFLEQVRRQVPGVELVADASLSHQTDLYMPEHVFAGTPVFPGVMAIEALVQAAMACVDRPEWPLLSEVQFHSPLIVPEDSTVIMRTLALADLPHEGAVRVRVAIRSDHDGFTQNHFEADCWFGKEPEADALPPHELALPRPLPDRLSRDPEEFNPVPLFQGKFFRRIEAIRTLAIGEMSLTEIRTPIRERYFQDSLDATLLTPSPALRDACLQSGALILPPGCLPSRLKALRFHRPATPGETVLCGAWVRSKSSAGFAVDIAAFDAGGELLEEMRGLLLAPTGTGALGQPPPSPVALARVPGDLQALLPHTPHAIAFVPHAELAHPIRPTELESAEVEHLIAGKAAPRQVTLLANLVAARRAALAYAQRMQGHGVALAPASIALAHRPDGKPELRFADRTLGGLFQGADISLADGSGLSIAWLAPAPVGADLELVERRDTETWRGLLGDDGYALALRVSAQAAEPFDWAATRVWTLLETGKKANNLQRILPQFDSPRGGSWLGFVATINETELEFLSATLALPQSESLPRKHPSIIVLTVVGRRTPAHSGRAPASISFTPAEGFARVLADFQAGMARLQVLCAGDPCEPGLAVRHAEFISVIETTSQRLCQLDQTTAAADLPTLQKRFHETLLELLAGSENFRHTLVKPFGYAGDFRLLQMLVGNTCASRGLAYHFDQSQLEYPASVACRQRVEWITDELVSRLKARPAQPLTILDLGIGAAPVEQCLLRQYPETPLHVHAIDLEPAALEYVRQALAGPRLVLHSWHLNLHDPSALSKTGELAAQADIAIALGLLEALANDEALRLLQTLLRSLPPGAVPYTENFVPTHPTRPIMEWFLDFHLSYRSLEELRTLALQAGADPARMELRLDSTGSLALLKLTK
jgi:enediyne polyketide synthase